MNLQDLFEKDNKEEDEQSIDIRDPATKWLVKKARAKYAYAETDLEAFVQFMRDEVNAEKDRIQANTDNIDTEHEINIAQASDISSVEKINAKQEQHIKRLERKEKDIDHKMAKFDAVKKDVEMRMDKLDQATLEKNKLEF